MVSNSYTFDPYPLAFTMQRLAENVRMRRLEIIKQVKPIAQDLLHQI